MNQLDRLEAQLEERLAYLGGSSSDYTMDILARTARTRQRPAWTFPGRWFPMLFHSPGDAMALPTPWRTAWFLLFIALLAAALGAAGVSIVGTRGLLGPNEARDPRPAAVLLPTACDRDVPLERGYIATVAGTGERGSSGDADSAAAAALTSRLSTLAVYPDGGLLFFDDTARTLRRVAPDGIIDQLIGPPSLRSPIGVAIDDAGNAFVGGYYAARIWMIDPTGAVTVVAGTGVGGWSGVDGPAIDARILLSQLAVGPQGDVYFDGGPSFATVDQAGLLHAFAGTGFPGFSGDGGPAIEAQFSEEVEAVAADDSGNVYLGDTNNHRIRMVDPAGTITTIAGNGTAGWAGDGGRATDASLGVAVSVAVDRDGTIYVADQGTHTVRRIATDGIITTIAGTGEAGYSGDCGPGAEAQLDSPYGVAVREGVVYIMDEGNSRIRMVIP